MSRQTRESSRPPKDETRRFGWVDDLVRDARFYLRSLTHRGNRGFAAVAILTLAIGIGAATTIFSVSYGFLRNAFPFEDVDGIWQPWINFPPERTANLTRVPRNFSIELAKLPAVESVFECTYATGDAVFQVEGANGPEPYQNYLISGTSFDFLGIAPIMGRTIRPSDIGPDGTPADVVVLSYAAWRRFFPGDPDPVGKTIEFRDRQGAAHPKTVIGVMPERFGSEQLYEIGDTVWTPLPGPNFSEAAANMTYRPRIRLKPGVSKEVAEQQVAALYAELAKTAPPNTPFYQNGPGDSRTPRAFNTTLRDFVSSTFDPLGVVTANLRYLSIGVGLLLLIACMNVANLQLARAAVRNREIALRLALGTSRGRLIRQLLTESLILSLAGAAIGVGLAWGCIRMTRALMPPNLFDGPPLPNSAVIGLDGTVLLFSAVVAVASGILFGLAPAIQSTRPRLSDALKDGSRGSVGVHGARIRGVLVVAEVAFSIVLLVVASVTLWGYVRLMRIDPGYDPDNLYVVATPGVPATDGRLKDLIDRMRAVPALESVSQLTSVGNSSPYTLDGQPKDDTQRVDVAVADEAFVHTAGMRLLRGRNFTADEVRRGDPVALVGGAAAELWPGGQDPIGKRITLDVLRPQQAPNGGEGSVSSPPAEAPMLTIIGIVNDFRPGDVTEEPESFVLAPLGLSPAGGGITIARVRRGHQFEIQRELQAVARSIDPGMTIATQDLAEQFGNQFATPRFNFALFGSLAAMALVLAVAGVYSVLSYHVGQRTREYGVRLALGANRSAILSLVLQVGGRLLAFGVVVGLAGAFGLSRVLSNQTQIFKVELGDPGTLGVATASVALLSAAAFAACCLPARRATRVDPLTALRAE